MPDDIGSVCPICGGDRIAGALARRLGYRPDAAFAKLKEAECRIKDLEGQVQDLEGRNSRLSRLVRENCGPDNC